MSVPLAPLFNCLLFFLPFSDNDFPETVWVCREGFGREKTKREEGRMEKRERWVQKKKLLTFLSPTARRS